MNAVVEHTQEKTAYDRLPRRERRFIDAYVPGATGAEAIRTAGYKGLYAHVAAYRLLKRPDIQEAIAERELHYIAEMGVRAERIMRETIAIATVDPRKLEDENGKAIPLHLLPADVAAAIAAVEVENISIGGETGTRYKYKFWDKNKALDKLGQYLKLWDAKGPTVNVDARSVHNTVHVGGSEAIRSVADLGRVIATVGSSQSLPAPDQNGSVLRPALRDESPGHRASVDAGEDSGSSGAA